MGVVPVISDDRLEERLVLRVVNDHVAVTEGLPVVLEPLVGERNHVAQHRVVHVKDARGIVVPADDAPVRDSRDRRILHPLGDHWRESVRDQAPKQVVGPVVAPHGPQTEVRVHPAIDLLRAHPRKDVGPAKWHSGELLRDVDPEC